MKVERTNFNGDWDDLCPYCGETQGKHKEIIGEYKDVRYEHRLPCEAEKLRIRKETRAQARTLKTFIFLGWILVPLLIALFGFASVLIGTILFVISLFKIAWTGLELYGKPEKWLRGYKSKIEKERKMKHYYYHCERNPNGFRSLFLENLEDEEEL